MASQRNTGGTGAEVAMRKPVAWSHYWSDSDYTADDRRALLIRELTCFFCSAMGWPLMSSARSWFDKISVLIDWEQISTLSGLFSLREAMLHAPGEALSCLGAAVYEALFICAPLPPPPSVEGPAKVLVRLHNHQASFLPISAIRADQVGRLVTIRGTATRISPVRPLITSMQFICAKCTATHEVPFPDGRFQPPVSCGMDGCRSRTLAPNRSAVTCVDWQRVQVQGMPRDERGVEGRVPRPMDVELLDDLAEKVAPGDVVTVTGIVKVIQGEPASGKRFGDAKRQCLFLPYIEAVSVVCRAACSSGRAPSGPGSEIVVEPQGLNYLPPNMPGFTRLDLDFIRTFTDSCEGDQLRQFVHSLAPGICGMEAVKAGLVLALFGGVRKGAAPGSSSSNVAREQGVPVRGDIHVLIIGDPGLGKSQLLQAAAAAAPRGVYVCGSGTSSAGLTVSVVREGGGFCFDAGALVLADRGVCCVDEFDKATQEHAAMLGAMEQQEVAVAKAGLVAALPARTTVLAAANPVDGHYNRGKTLMANVKISPAMLSRFDLVFLLLDRPDAERDQKLTAHVMAVHSGLGGVPGAEHAARLRHIEGERQQQTMALLTDGRTGIAGSGSLQEIPLRERLKERRPDDEPLPQQLLRKYIAYARQYVHPVLSLEASAAIKKFYLQLRQQSVGNLAGPPVTHRQLESLVRLAEARARVDLRGTVTAQDAADAVDIMRETLDGMLTEGPGLLDFALGAGAVGGGNGGSRGRTFQGERRRFMEALQRHCEAKGSKDLETHELFSVADCIELGVPDTKEFIEKLNETGDLLKRGGGKFGYNGALRPRVATAGMGISAMGVSGMQQNFPTQGGASQGVGVGGRHEVPNTSTRAALCGKRGPPTPPDEFGW